MLNIRCHFKKKKRILKTNPELEVQGRFQIEVQRTFENQMLMGSDMPLDNHDSDISIHIYIYIYIYMYMYICI